MLRTLTRVEECGTPALVQWFSFNVADRTIMVELYDRSSTRVPAEAVTRLQGLSRPWEEYSENMQELLLTLWAQHHVGRRGSESSPPSPAPTS